MEFGIKDVLYIIGIVVSASVSFLGTRHKLKEYIRDKNDELKDKIHNLELQLNNQKAKDDLQQQVIDQIGQQMNSLIPKLLKAIQYKRQENE
jgi:BMFP domain-containing protein YqiC